MALALLLSNELRLQLHPFDNLYHTPRWLYSSSRQTQPCDSPGRADHAHKEKTHVTCVFTDPTDKIPGAAQLNGETMSTEMSIYSPGVTIRETQHIQRLLKMNK